MYNQQGEAGSLGMLSALVHPCNNKPAFGTQLLTSTISSWFFLEMKASCNNLHEGSASVILSLQPSSLTVTVKKQDLFHTRLNAGMP